MYEPLLTPYMRRHALTAPASPVRGSFREVIQTTETPAMSFEEQAEHAAQTALKASLQQSGAASVQQNGGTYTQSSGDQRSFKAGSSQAPRAYYPVNPYFSGAPQALPLPPTQSATTQELYEKARQAAASKAISAGSTRRPGLPNARRPWSQEEEYALMNGLDLVRGPHWAQILGLYGENGAIGDVLKERSQVQLKDKARNLKLFFLKSNIEVPFYLQAVTGELKTRAPSTAARKEAEERKRLADEEVARANGIAMLAQGLQDHGSGSTRGARITPPGDHSPLHVVEPEPRVYSSPIITPPVTSDEHLRRSLMAANTGPVPAASMG